MSGREAFWYGLFWLGLVPFLLTLGLAFLIDPLGRGGTIKTRGEYYDLTQDRWRSNHQELNQKDSTS